MVDWCVFLGIMSEVIGEGSNDGLNLSGFFLDVYFVIDIFGLLDDVFRASKLDVGEFYLHMVMN